MLNASSPWTTSLQPIGDSFVQLDPALRELRADDSERMGSDDCTGSCRMTSFIAVATKSGGLYAGAHHEPEP